MSLTSTLLLNKPIKLPSGQIFTHNPDHKKVKTQAQEELSERNTAIRNANIELIYKAIATSPKPISSKGIQAASGFSHATVFYALHALEEWPTGPRITRILNGVNQGHTFEVKNHDR